jgi:diguanylate cyclase (GGDEF)-like protein
MNTSGFKDFESASKAILDFLHKRLGFDLWMITRREGDDWIILQSEDHGYGVKPGSVFKWGDSFCSQMVLGKGPNIAPDSTMISAYSDAPIGQLLNINAYIGLPLTRADGSLFGTLCAINPTAQPAALADEQAFLELIAATLSTILQLELKLTSMTRRAELLAEESLTDPLTGLYNRRGWDKFLASEEERCRRYGHPAVVMVIDIDALKQVNDKMGHAEGDNLITRTAAVLSQSARSQDVVARLGGDEFGIISVECDSASGKVLFERIQNSLAAANIKASIGIASRNPSHGLEAALQEADQNMYKIKRSRQ